MVHQHFQLVPVLSVTENIMLGTESVRGPFLNRRVARQRILEISEQYGLEVDPDALIQDLPVGVQQRVEIIKALYRNADILILDEPTAVLTPQEAEGLFTVMQTLIDRGVSIIFITHKLKEALRICDVIRSCGWARWWGTPILKSRPSSPLASMMVGREVLLQVEKDAAKPTDVTLEITDLNVLDDRELPAVRDLSLTLRAGEILGWPGCRATARRELTRAITSLRAAESA